MNSKPPEISRIQLFGLRGMKQTLSLVDCLSSYMGKNRSLGKHRRDLTINICRMGTDRPPLKRENLAKNKEMSGANWFGEASLSVSAEGLRTAVTRQSQASSCMSAFYTDRYTMALIQEVYGRAQESGV